MSIFDLPRVTPKKKEEEGDPKNTWRVHPENPKYEINGEHPPKMRTRGHLPGSVKL